MEVKKNTLLIVDDENTNLKVLTHILGEEYTIYTATNGENAIEKAKELHPDLILLDILMPGMDGYETLSEIKSSEDIKKIPVVFITGLDSSEDEEKGLSLDAVDYITKPFSAAIVKLRVRNQIQIINQLRTIENLSMIDQLTNIPNRRCFDNHLHMEWKQAIREQTPLSLLMMDLDKFKRVNDNYGHQQGDLVLKTIAGVFTRSLKRASDFTARWGGEEFTILLPNTPLEGAIDVAENIRADVEQTLIPIVEPCSSFPDNDSRQENNEAEIKKSGNVESELKITISIGISSLMPTSESSIDSFISSADKALYMAKEAGRNRVAYIV